MGEELIKRLRAEEHWAIERSEAELKREAADRITALIEAGDRLAELGWHYDGCQIHGRRYVRPRCTCGYTEAVKAWKEARGNE